MIRNPVIVLMSLLFLVLLAVRVPAAPPSPLTVSAAADLTPAFREMGTLFQRQKGIPAIFNFGSSGLLPRQIQQAALGPYRWALYDAIQDSRSHETLVDTLLLSAIAFAVLGSVSVYQERVTSERGER